MLGKWTVVYQGRIFGEFLLDAAHAVGQGYSVGIGQIRTDAVERYLAYIELIFNGADLTGHKLGRAVKTVDRGALVIGDVAAARRRGEKIESKIPRLGDKLLGPVEPGPGRSRKGGEAGFGAFRALPELGGDSLHTVAAGRIAQLRKGRIHL